LDVGLDGGFGIVVPGSVEAVVNLATCTLGVVDLVGRKVDDPVLDVA
jgi:hypothetical protein